MCRLLHPIYRGDPELERTLKVLRRFQLTEHLPGSPPPFILDDVPELEGLELDEGEAEVVMEDNDVIGIANDRKRKIIDYAIFDPNSMNIRIIRPTIDATQFEFKPMISNVATISQYSDSSSTSRVKSVEACQVIKLRIGKEYGGSIPRNIQSSEEMPVQDNSQDEVESAEERSS
ncbi:hypothetical protein KIW84_075327 [Lathyrus oleraceus]|uniref:Uncharacterized protein n=1 Tax=Pisum sativum TaxID=3888 RepID=A0A9D4VWE0_PEA|nr:hypothetical protein KIW84_075327 [Pisum sativum]